jgi:hypothetical protein
MFCPADFLAHTIKPDDLNAVGLNRNLQIIQDRKKAKFILFGKRAERLR